MTEQAWTAREFTDRERNRWLARKGEYDWLLIAPDGVQFGPMLEVTATALVSILAYQGLLTADLKAAQERIEALKAKEVETFSAAVDATNEADSLVKELRRRAEQAEKELRQARERLSHKCACNFVDGVPVPEPPFPAECIYHADRHYALLKVAQEIGQAMEDRCEHCKAGSPVKMTPQGMEYHQRLRGGPWAMCEMTTRERHALANLRRALGTEAPQ